jgi:hypothetical protein
VDFSRVFQGIKKGSRKQTKVVGVEIKRWKSDLRPSQVEKDLALDTPIVWKSAAVNPLFYT